MNDFKIKPELKKDWAECAGANCMDPYSFGVVIGTCAVFEKLDAGSTVKESHDAMYGTGLSGFMAGCVASWVSKYHERGEEFNDFWNEQFGVPKEKANGGTVNPAILNINTEEQPSD
jgi:hypothetical protein